MLLAQRLFIWSLRHYQLHWSQSRWFRSRKCSFPYDTCSAFALRNIRAFGVKKGCGMIYCRVRRCRDFRMYGFAEQRIGWDHGFSRWLPMESPEEIHRGIYELMREGENRRGISTIIQSVCQIQQYRLGKTPDVWSTALRTHRLYAVVPYVRGTKDYTRFLLYRSLRGILIRTLCILPIFWGYPILASVFLGLLCVPVIRRNVQQYRILRFFDTC